MTLPESREALLALAERVEKATGPSQHLDAQIFILLDPDAEHIIGRKPGRFPQAAIYGPRSTFWEWALDETKEPPAIAAIPAFTASLDAAITLVPEGWGMSVEQERPTRMCEASVSPPGDEPWGHTAADAEGYTLALALCAAALKARAQTPSGGEGE